jgi:NAD(P)-dependent dehydrogenase (short-subunit alcohol dehydrogenase family)
MKTVVVGASSGLGRSIAIALGQKGGSVALLARRHDRLVDAAKEAGPGSLAIECDVIDSSSCRSAIEEAAAGLGGIDALVYSTGVGHLGRLVDTDAEAWQRSFNTNVIGAALITSAALPYLTASNGVAAYLSSVSASLTPPWPGLGVYITSKAALIKLVEAFRAEHPSVGFTNVIVGDCAGGEGPSMTEFVNSWDPELMGELFPIWEARSLLAGSLVEVDELIRVVDTVLQCGATASIPSVAVLPRSGPAGTGRPDYPDGRPS